MKAFQLLKIRQHFELPHFKTEYRLLILFSYLCHRLIIGSICGGIVFIEIPPHAGECSADHHILATLRCIEIALWVTSFFTIEGIGSVRIQSGRIHPFRRSDQFPHPFSAFILCLQFIAQCQHYKRGMIGIGFQ